MLHSDLYKILKQWLDEALPDYMFGTISLRRELDPEDEGKWVCNLYTDVPGPLIGKAGCLYDKYSKLLMEELKLFGVTSINIVEVEGTAVHLRRNITPEVTK